MKFFLFVIVVLRSSIAQIAVFSVIIYMSITSYFYSFVSTREQIIRYITRNFASLRKLSYFIVGIKVVIIGEENLPTNTTFIFASKHQSAIDTSFFFNIFKENTVFAYKKEIWSVPMWGRVARKFGGILIDRKNSTGIMDSVVKQATEYLQNNYNVVIFPEGKRVAVNKTSKFKKGVVKIYMANNVPVIPVALNTGIILPRKSWFIYPGTMVIKFLPPIMPGLSEQEFLSVLESQINQESAKLLEI